MKQKERIGKYKREKDESPCRRVRKWRSCKEKNELRKTSRTVCPGWPFFFGGQTPLKKEMEEGRKERETAE